MKKHAACLLLMAAVGIATALADTQQREPFLYVAWNPGAALSFFPTEFVTRSILPTVLFNQEAGVALAAGFYRDSQVLEGRAAFGNSNAYYFVMQFQFGWSWFFAESLGWMDKGPYAGACLRYWDLIQVYSGVQSHNIAPMLDVGWWFDLGGWFIDIRMSQVFAVASFSSIPYSRPGIAFIASPIPGISPVMPIGLVQIGIKL
jgi:hypothetical protein